jgi:3D (Asp-Asp-Asp) domain-containing protein
MENAYTMIRYLAVSILALWTMAHFSNNIFDDLRLEADALRAENYTLKEQLDEIVTIKKVTATMYEPLVAQTDATPNITADGTRINTRHAGKYRFVAVSRDLLAINGGPLHYGDYVIIEGISGVYDGVWQVKDTMHPRWTDRIDLLVNPGTEPFKAEGVILKIFS